jgi:hypothetical protein
MDKRFYPIGFHSGVHWGHPIGLFSILLDRPSDWIVFHSARQLVGKTRWVFRQPHGLSTAWLHVDDYSNWMDWEPLDWTHSADGRPSGSSLQLDWTLN